KANIHLSVDEVKKLDSIMLAAYDLWAGNSPWEDGFFRSHDAFSVTLKFGQDNPIAATREAWENFQTTWERLYAFPKIGRFVCALATVQCVKTADGTECAVLCHYDRLKEAFAGSGRNGPTFYPLGFTKVGCNAQANCLPNYFAGILTEINNKHSARILNAEGEEVQGPPVGQCIKFQGYSAQKKVYRNSSAEHEIGGGLDAAVLGACGSGGANDEKIKRHMRALEVQSSYDKTASRITQGTGSLGLRSEMELVIYPERLREEDRTGSFVVRKLLKPMSAVYFKPETATPFQASLLVLRPGVYPSLLLDAGYYWAKRARRLWKMAMKITKNGVLYCPWYLVEEIAICLRNAAFAQTGDMRLLSSTVHKAASLWDTIRTNGIPTMHPLFWPNGPTGRISAEQWPKPPSGGVRASVAYSAIQFHFGKEAADMYRRRFEMEFQMDMIEQSGTSNGTQLRHVAAVQIFEVYQQDIQNKTRAATMSLLKKEKDALEKIIDPAGRSALERTILRRKTALIAWEGEGYPLDKQRGYSFITRMLSTASGLVPNFPVSASHPKVQSTLLVERLLKMAQGQLTPGAPLFGKRMMNPKAVTETAIERLTRGFPVQIHAEQLQWMAEEMCKTLARANIDIIPWTATHGQWANASHWTWIGHALPSKQGEAEYLPHDEEDAEELRLQTQRQKDNPSPHGWSATVPNALWSIDIHRTTISSEMHNGFEQLGKAGGKKTNGMNYKGLYEHLLHLFERDITTPVHRYILFCATLLCKIFPRHQYQVSNPNAPYATVADGNKIIRAMVMIPATKKTGTGHVRIMSASFIAWVTYNLYEQQGFVKQRFGIEEGLICSMVEDANKKTADHAVYWGLFAAWGFHSLRSTIPSLNPLALYTHKPL
ncbi:hypothetical protein CALVIDRAFT_531523, partial [Calocera viscosa TUFC12733]